MALLSAVVVLTGCEKRDTYSIRILTSPLCPGMQWQLQVNLSRDLYPTNKERPNYSKYEELIWESMNPEIATIENGIIYPIAEGDVEVTVYHPGYKISDRATFHIGHYVEFTDPDCYDYLKSAGYDTDNDGLFSLEEMANITEIRDTIEFSQQEEEGGIRWIPYLGMMKNLEAFMSIEYPESMNYFHFPTIDFSRNTKLKYLTLCGWENVKIANPDLKYLFLYRCKDMDVDLRMSPNLEHLYCFPYLESTIAVPYSLDCSQNPNLKYVISEIENIIIPRLVIDQTDYHTNGNGVRTYELFRDFDDYSALLTNDNWKDTCTWVRYLPQESWVRVDPTVHYIGHIMYIKTLKDGITIQ